MLRRTAAWTSDALMPSSCDSCAYVRFLRSSKSFNSTTISKDFAIIEIRYSRIANMSNRIGVPQEIVLVFPKPQTNQPAAAPTPALIALQVIDEFDFLSSTSLGF